MVERLGFRTEVRRLGKRDHRVIAIWIELDERRRSPREAPLGFVERDPVQPRGYLSTLLESRQASPGAQEHLLRHLLSLAGVKPEAPQRTNDAFGVNHDQFGEGVLIAGARTPNQRALGGSARAHRRLLGRSELPPPLALDLPGAMMVRPMPDVSDFT